MALLRRLPNARRAKSNSSEGPTLQQLSRPAGPVCLLVPGAATHPAPKCVLVLGKRFAHPTNPWPSLPATPPMPTTSLVILGSFVATGLLSQSDNVLLHNLRRAPLVLECLCEPLPAGSISTAHTIDGALKSRVLKGARWVVASDQLELSPVLTSAAVAVEPAHNHGFDRMWVVWKRFRGQAWHQDLVLASPLCHNYPETLRSCARCSTSEALSERYSKHEGLQQRSGRSGLRL
jgi:hypothetical protein